MPPEPVFFSFLWAAFRGTYRRDLPNRWVGSPPWISGSPLQFRLVQVKHRYSVEKDARYGLLDRQVNSSDDPGDCLVVVFSARLTVVRVKTKMPKNILVYISHQFRALGVFQYITALIWKFATFLSEFLLADSNKMVFIQQMKQSKLQRKKWSEGFHHEGKA